ncbi:hypothetical protein CI109_101394 [Kwoniella shandongensis]|uniref:Uncharacterized protein n=1 Tax=Kwoniella shandongensis TaxID=1734106 RepID=A0AAJ8MVJ8_9TREE
MFNTSLSLFALMAFVLPSLADSSIFTKTDAKMTFYYDVEETSSGQEACGSTAGDPVQAGWATSSGINTGIPYCEKVRGYSLNQIGTGRIVAFDATAIAEDPEKWCGREVQIYKADGSKFEYSAGPLYIWDGCAACAGGGAILDLSAPTFVEVNGGTCGGTNPSGLTYEVLDNYIVDPSVGLGGSAATSDAESTTDSTVLGFTSSPSEVLSTSSAGSSSTPSPIVSVASSSVESSSEQATPVPTRTIRYSSSLGWPTSVASNLRLAADYVTSGSATVEGASSSSNDQTTSTQSADASSSTQDSSADLTPDTEFVSSTSAFEVEPAPTSSSESSPDLSDGDCIFGAWQCNGLELRVCNYQSTSELAWESIYTCSSVCGVTASGSINCD